jgi:ATP-binding cassette subfamily B multidrug efflux pump
MMGGGPPGRMFRQEVEKPKNVGATLGRLVKYFKPYWLVLILIAGIIILSTWTQVITPDLTGQSVDCYLTPITSTSFSMPGIGSMSAAKSNCWYTTVDPQATNEARAAGLGGLILLIVGLYIANALLNGLQFFLMSWTGQHMLKTLRVQVFAHLHKLSLNFYAENEAGNVMSRITNDMETISQAISFALVNVTSGLLLLVWVAVVMMTKSLPYALISMLVVPLMILATSWISGQARKAYRVTRQQIGKVNANLQESISGVREVQAFSREDANIESFRDTNAANRDANIKAVSYTAALAPILEALGYLGLTVVIVVGGLALTGDGTFLGTSLSLGLIITFIGYVQRFNQPIQQISSLWTNIQNAVAGAERIFGLLDTAPEIVNAPGAQDIPSIQGKVEFDHVTAAYIQGVNVLCDVSFSVEPGQTVAVVGPTGAGKTTIINLIPRFYDVVSGQIRVDGIDISTVTTESLRRQIGIVLQDTFLFSDTVMNNIRFGRPEASDEEVVAAAQLARADSFIQHMPQGYQTWANMARD